MALTTVIHRHSFSVDEIIRALIGQDVADAGAYRATLAGGVFEVEVAHLPTELGETRQVQPVDEVAQQPSSSPTQEESTDDVDPPEPERKGGPLARKAGILCTEKGFQVFLEVASEDEARTKVCEVCSVTSRVDLDHDGDAAEAWDRLEGKYRLWLQGLD